MKNSPKQRIKSVIALQGNTMELYGALNELIARNQEITILNTIVTNGVRQLKSPIVDPNTGQIKTEGIIIVFIIFSNPGPLIGLTPPSEKPN